MKKLMAACMSMLFLLMIFAGCGDTNKDGGSSVTSSSSTASDKSDPSETTNASQNDSGGSDSEEGSSDPQSSDGPVRVAALKGPTAMGMVQMMQGDDYEFSLAAAPDEVTPMIVQGDVDIAAVPANLAAILFDKTDGGISAISVNTLGVLYIVENGESVNSVQDLKGKTIFASGKGATPEYALNYMLSENGIDPEKDVKIEYKSEHAECVSSLTSTENAVAMLPQPFVTVAQGKDDSIRVALDMTQQWEEISEKTLVTGVTIVRNEFLEKNPEAVSQFIKDQFGSTLFTNEKPAEAAKLMEEFDILQADIAEKAIPECNIIFIAGQELKDKLSAYYDILMKQNPQSIGGSLPSDEFYYDENEQAA